MEKKAGAAYVALTLSCVLWGSSFIAMRRLVAAVDPAAVVWMRSMIAVAVVLPFRRIWKAGNYRKGDLPLLGLLVLLQPCLYFLLEANALTLTTSTQAGIVSAVVPVLVALGAALFLGERLLPGRIAGIALSAAGIVLLSLGGRDDGTARNAALGNLMEFGAMICAAANFLLLKRLSGRYGPWTIAAYQAAAGALFFLPAAPSALAFLASAPGPSQIVSILYLGAAVTLGAFGLYNVGQSMVDAGRAATFINLVPILAAAFGWLFLGEGLSPLQLAAAALVVLGVRLGQGLSGMRKEGGSRARA